MNGRTQALLHAQASRFARVDPFLPGAPRPPDGDVLTAALPGGSRVAGVLVRTVHQPDELPSLWQALEVNELYPLLGDSGAEGMHALLGAWRGTLDRVGPAGADSSCTVSWPSRDVEVSGVLLDHGLMPLSVLAVRTGPSGTPEVAEPSSIAVRRAEPTDLETVLGLAMAELRYSAHVGPTSVRPSALTLKRNLFGRRLALGEPVWLAEQDGVPVGLADCTVSDLDATALLPGGRWGYVNTVSIAPDARGWGVGRQLMAQVHRELRRLGATRTYLYYNPANPLSSVFWSKQGYRPLWTLWEVRPADALR